MTRPILVPGASVKKERSDSNLWHLSYVSGRFGTVHFGKVKSSSWSQNIPLGKCAEKRNMEVRERPSVLGRGTLITLKQSVLVGGILVLCWWSRSRVMWKIKACQITRPMDFNAETKLLVLMSHRHCVFILAQGANGVYFGHKKVHILIAWKWNRLSDCSSVWKRFRC